VTMELSALAKLSPEQQTAELAEPYAVLRVLAMNGQREAVEKLQRNTEAYWQTRSARKSQPTDVQR
jgi:hypothetical protein